MLKRFILQAACLSASLAAASYSVAAPVGEPQKPQGAVAAPVKPRALSLQASRDVKVSRDLDQVIATPVSAEMSVAEQKAVTELAQKAVGLRNAREYRQQLRQRLAEVREALADNPEDGALQAEMQALEEKLAAADDMTQMMQLQLQDAMQKQQQAFQLLSNIMKSQHETTKSIIQNIK